MFKEDDSADPRTWEEAMATADSDEDQPGGDSDDDRADEIPDISLENEDEWQEESNLPNEDGTEDKKDWQALNLHREKVLMQARTSSAMGVTISTQSLLLQRNEYLRTMLGPEAFTSSFATSGSLNASPAKRLERRKVLLDDPFGLLTQEQVQMQLQQYKATEMKRMMDMVDDQLRQLQEEENRTAQEAASSIEEPLLGTSETLKSEGAVEGGESSSKEGGSSSSSGLSGSSSAISLPLPTESSSKEKKKKKSSKSKHKRRSSTSSSSSSLSSSSSTSLADDKEKKKKKKSKSKSSSSSSSSSSKKKRSSKHKTSSDSSSSLIKDSPAAGGSSTASSSSSSSSSSAASKALDRAKPPVKITSRKLQLLREQIENELDSTLDLLIEDEFCPMSQNFQATLYAAIVYAGKFYMSLIEIENQMELC
jgi:hypothetical protein